MHSCECITDGTVTLAFTRILCYALQCIKPGHVCNQGSSFFGAGASEGRKGSIHDGASGQCEEDHSKEDD